MIAMVIIVSPVYALLLHSKQTPNNQKFNPALKKSTIADIKCISIKVA